MPRYRDWDRDPEEYRPRPARENPYQRRRQWDDEPNQSNRRKTRDDYDDWDDDNYDTRR